MAVITNITVTDDIDGSPDAETFVLGVNGEFIEIDLAAKNSARLMKELARYQAHGRRVRLNAPGRRPREHTVGNAENPSLVREWATGAGVEVSSRGRIPASVLEAYRQAHKRG